MDEVLAGRIASGTSPAGARGGFAAAVAWKRKREQFQQTCEAVLRPELRQNKRSERFRPRVKALSHEERRSQRMKTGLRGAFFPLLLATATVSGCTTTSGGVAGAAGAAVATGAGVYITALQGGLVSRNAGGAQLSKADMQRALEAEYRALEAAPGGQPVVWQGKGVSGSVVAAAPYQVGSQNCRQYSHTLTVGGWDTATRGAACRNADGAWAPLS